MRLPVLAPTAFVILSVTAAAAFSEADLELLWQSLTLMFDHDRSASRGTMAPQKLVVFKHQTALGNAPAHKLFERVSVKRRSTVEVARAFSDYEVVVDRDNLPTGIEVLDLI